ncbi:helix-turn-helix domain-containing protein [Aquabacterium sp. A7-Y]|uniref:helix-turn-helix domain-containing protein n=1 Tax=Aquabacterium sp. A7-Y TaxID=1349605 RepID=UPI0039FC446C
MRGTGRRLELASHAAGGPPVSLSDAFAQVLRRCREQAGLTPAALALRAGLSPGIVERLESGGCEPSVLVVSQLAEALGMRGHELVRLVEAAIGDRAHGTGRVARHDDAADDDPAQPRNRSESAP